MDVTVGDVVVTKNGDIAVVVDYKPGKRKYPWVYKISLTKQYKARAEDFVAVIADEADIDELDDQANEKMSARQAAGPSSIKNLRVGDEIQVRIGGLIHKVEFAGYKPRNRKYPLIYKAANGKCFKTRLDLLVE